MSAFLIKDGINQSLLIHPANLENNDNAANLTKGLQLLTDFGIFRPRILILNDNKIIHQNNTFQNLISDYEIDRIISYNKDDCSKMNFNNHAILIIGRGMQKMIEQLENRAYRTVLEVDLNAMLHNFNYFRSKLKPETKTMVMLKASSYGSGKFQVARFLELNAVDYLGVAITIEAVEMRKQGIQTPILVMNPEVSKFNDLIDYKLEPAIYNFLMLSSLHQFLKDFGIKDFPVHIKLDTGMRRLGFEDSQITELIAELRHSPTLRVKSVFTHLAATDEAIHDEFTRQQFQRFEAMSLPIMDALPYPIMRHALNSNGINRFPEWQYDMVRLGIGIYGAIAYDQDKLKNISTLKTQVSQIKQVPSHQTIGYSRKGVALRDTTIATLPIGYADGYRRKLSNGLGRAFINGQYAPIIGNVCMDMCMIDVTDIDVKCGDTAILFGNEVPVMELAAKLETIPYEIFTSVAPRVKSLYVI